MAKNDDLVIPAPTAPVRLIQVTTENNNKFYNMTPQGTVFLAEWGRVGVTKESKQYPISKWNSVYKDKVYRKDKPYKDVTHLVKESVSKTALKPIADSTVRQLMDRLLSYAKKSVTDNYTISSDSVTATQVAEAQKFLDELTPRLVIGAEKTDLDKLLLELYMVIPRRMGNVRDHLLQVPVIQTAQELQAVRTIIDFEQKTLDVMAGQVKMATVNDASSTLQDATVLDTLGIQVEVGTAADEAIARKMMAGDAREFKAVYRVIHIDTQSRYSKHIDTVKNKKAELFWHGSRNENWISILQTGLKIRPSNAVLTGAMFGHGIYFADKYRKSAGYTSLSGARWTSGRDNRAFLALMDVHVGKQYDILHHSHECYTLDAKKLVAKGGYDSVFAKGGADLINNEYIVYQEAQSTIKYLVEVGQ